MARRLTYKAAGVDIDAGDALVERIASAVKRTHGPRVLDRYGGFAGVFSLDYDERLFKRNYRHPLLVAGTDGVGTKLRVAIDAGRYDRLGQDVVGMCVNDVLTMGAEPLFFLDYIGTGKLAEGALAEFVRSVADACAKCDYALLGGETAEMPGFYDEGDFDVAGFAVGVVEKDRIIDGSRVRPGDAVLGLASNGIHSNGYSLVRKIVFDRAGLSVEDEIPGLGVTVVDELLRPTRLYVRPVLRVLSGYEVKRVVHGMVHVTGGGLVGNVPRVLPEGLEVRIDTKAWVVPPIFEYLRKTGRVPKKEMWRVFNMGIGFVMIVSEFYADSIAETLDRAGETVYRLGTVTKGKGGVKLSGGRSKGKDS